MDGRERVYLDGRFLAADAARISPLDRGFLHGDGFFETLRIWRGRPFRLGWHMDRLDSALRETAYQGAVDPQELVEAVDKLIGINKVTDGRLRITVSRGIMPGLEISRPPAPTVFIQAASMRLSPPGHCPPIVLALSDHRVCPDSRTAGFKSTSYQANLLALAAGRKRGAHEVLLLNSNGHLAEGAMSNVFFVRANKLYTPHQNCGLLPGIAREAVFQLCKDQNILVRRGKYGPADLWQASEVFCTNSLRGIMPVERISERPSMDLRERPLTERLQAAYGALVDRECAP
jgi:branched-subunit amino acid aminotransferase/4-amino-4-deoxychorismate lyase